VADPRRVVPRRLPPEIDQTFDITGDVGTPGLPAGGPDGSLHLRSRAQDLFQPAQLTVGAAARLTPRWTVAFDLAWHRWSAFENPAARIDSASTSAVPGSGRHPAAGAAAAAALPRHRGAAPRRRAHPRPDPLARRLRYEPSPAPPQRGATNFIDNDKHTLALGAGVDRRRPRRHRACKPISFDVALALTWLPSRDHAKLIAADPVGDYRSAGVIITGSVTSRWRF
jgi:hypothetical protein